MTEQNKWIQTEKQRDSNLELFRIITMLLIVAHHYVVNSGVTQYIYEDPVSIRGIFLLLFGAWGKTGINCFVLITGYFMCTSSMTAKRFFKLLLEVMFYRVAVNLIFWITGYQPLSMETLLRLLPVTKIDSSFTPAYIMFMLCIPFINILLKNISQKQHFYLILLMSFVYIFLGTLKFVFHVDMNYLSWFFVLYLYSSYVRLYPNKVFSNGKLWGWVCVGAIACSVASVIMCAWISTKIGSKSGYYFVSDSNTFLAFATGLSSFMFFKNLKIPYSKWINSIASTSFGVLLIHANSDSMRNWLWKDVLNNVDVYSKPWMPLHAVGSVLVVFAVCSGVDLLRIRFFEKPFFRAWDRYWPEMKKRFIETEGKILGKLSIHQ